MTNDDIIRSTKCSVNFISSKLELARGQFLVVFLTKTKLILSSKALPLKEKVKGSRYSPKKVFKYQIKVRNKFVSVYCFDAKNTP